MRKMKKMPRSCALALALALALAAETAPAAEGPSLRYGVAAFGGVDPLAEAPGMAACGADYVEPALSKAVALGPEALAAARRKLEATGLRAETMNWFLPGGDVKLTGPEVDRPRIRAYLEKSLELAESFGAKVIVFGSPGARSVPEGFPRERAWEQLKGFLRLGGEVIEARGYGMVIGIEALRRPETNIVNSVAEALRLAREVAHPRVRIIVDFYHLAYENEDPDVILEARDMIVHLQIADPRRRGFPTDAAGEPRYARFFANLARIGYRGRLSIEANSDRPEADCRSALAFLKGMAASAGADK